RGLAGAPHRARVPAAPLHAHAGPHGRVRERPVHRGRARAARGVSRGRGADRRRGRARDCACRAGPRRHARVRGRAGRRAGRAGGRDRGRRHRADDGRRRHRRARAAPARAPRAPARPQGAAVNALSLDTTLRGELRRNEPMSRHTSWRVGGPAELWFKPADLEDLARFLRELDPAVPVFWYGLGSNLLVRDGGLKGAVIAATGVFTVLERVGDAGVRAGASVPCTRLARQCIRWGLGPSEFFAGIPGRLGGALAMNAGAHGGETWERVRSVTTIDRSGEVHERTPDDYDVGYREV